VLCLLVGYPVAYYIARYGGRLKVLLLTLMIAPFWMSYLMRMLAWVNLLAVKPEDPGLFNRLLMWTPFFDHPIAWSSGAVSHLTVILGLVYGYIPFFILPLYAALDRIDRSHLEAARDLGASPFRGFLHVTLPLSKIGILGGAVLIALPMFGDYYTPDIVSGAPRTSMIGNQIDFYFHGGPQPTIGAAITVLLAAFLTVLMAYYMWTIQRASKELRTT
jgi:putrescine transport system permease protein